MTVRTRFAPSPTGYQHVGGLRTALFAYLQAKRFGGQFVLRIEDTDRERFVADSEEHLRKSLEWLNIPYDEGPDIGGPYGPYRQSEKLARYHEVAQELVVNGHAYVDTMSETETEKLRAQADESKTPFLYRNHRPEKFDTDWSVGKTLRFKTPHIKRYTWHDEAYGELEGGEEALDDFVLIKSDGYPTYNLAHVVDDHDMKITHVMRGSEFISSTPKFLALHEALGWERPHYVTLPPILGKDGGKKLSKRDGAQDAFAYKNEGYLPEALLNYLALLGWHPTDDAEILDVTELIAKFDITRLQKAGARFDEDKLKFINREWLRKLSDEEYAKRLGTTTLSDKALIQVVPLLKERAYTLHEATELIQTELSFLCDAPVLTKELLLKQDKEGRTPDHLRALESLIEALTKTDVESIKEALMPYADKEGRGAVLWPLRYALSGLEKSPDPFTILSLIGKEESLSRIRTALAIL